MKFLKSIWGVAILGAIVYLLTTAAILYIRRDVYFSARPSAIPLTVGPGCLWSFESAEVDTLITELKAQRKNLDAREVDLNKLAGQLASEREEMQKVRDDVQAMRDQLSAAIVEVQEAEVKNIKALAQTYSAVSPQAAVEIFAEMDEAMVVKILSMMKADRVGAIFQEMGSSQKGDNTMIKRAARISDKLRLLKSLKKESQKV